MPGARLTHEDRRRIAAWLDDGLGYAEIARRLGRPTSTISREVARNGEPGDYRADHAQRAAARRAPRRKPARAPRPASDRRSTRSAHAFAEQFATLLSATGLPRMGARVFVCLLTRDSGSLTAAELVGLLQVSPASVSKAVGYLEAMELVVRTPDAGSRRERYVIVDDVWLRAWRADTGAHAQVAAEARRGAEILGPDTPAGARLGKMGQFFAWLSEQMSHSGRADLVVQDALTVLAALVYTTGRLTADELAAALDWPRKRVDDALGAVERRPAIADPLALTSTRAGAYAVTTRPDRLNPAQRRALGARRGTVAAAPRR
ncbi:helix-turn-helix domain-containing protein [Dactylosporangium roseum]|uniref:Helix-turn-helix domain-containing protein n=1 Tax=Dactylosporangium roseum TaxID=47989 RepID=A0ABY5YW77_9ACTN|nr:helix-turn-helix domain-containing protein [Dactylosporangium roseum]UWZ34001.1 helix-turn-helix domain-containing protein [Dactylosporangium roseum]